MREIERGSAIIDLKKSEGPAIERRFLTDDVYSRGEPIEAMSFTLRFGILPEIERTKHGQDSLSSPRGAVHSSHAPDRVSLGKGPISRTAAAGVDFGGPGNIIYKISPLIEDLKGFRPALERADNGEFYSKRVPIRAIQGILFNEVDRERVLTTLEDLQERIMWGDLPVIDHTTGEDLRGQIVKFIESIPLRSIEKEKEIHKAIRGF